MNQRQRKKKFINEYKKGCSDRVSEESKDKLARSWYQTKRLVSHLRIIVKDLNESREELQNHGDN